MKNEEYAELFSYCSKNEIWVFTWYNKLKILHTPFKVKVKKSVGELILSSYVEVDEVKLSSNGKTVYLIEGRYYFYYYFEIFTHL
jgi:hypothetical protein